MEKSKHNIEIPKAVTDLTEAEFLSFLYSEREREESLIQWQGWNNWALVGAFVAVMWNAFTIWKDHSYLEGYDVVYYTSGIMAVLLMFYSWIIFLKRERGIDFSRMRWLKEVFPYHLVTIALVCSITFSLLIAAEDGYCYLFWLWSILGVLFAITIVSVICYRDRVMPTYAEGFMFPWVKVNIWYYAVMGSLYGPICVQSFKKVSSDILSNEFEIAACISVGVVIFYLFLKFNTGDKVVKRLDVIIDDYIYTDVSREKTIQEIVKNRMGYSVMDVCYRNMVEISNLMIECEEDYKRLDKIKEAVEGGECIIAQFNILQDECKVVFDRQLKVMKKSRKLSKKLREIEKITIGRKTIAAMHAILDENEKVMDRINVMKDKMPEVVNVVQKRVDDLKAAGGCCNENEPGDNGRE